MHLSPADSRPLARHLGPGRTRASIGLAPITWTRFSERRSFPRTPRVNGNRGALGCDSVYRKVYNRIEDKVMQRSSAWDVNRVPFHWHPAAPRASFPDVARRSAGRPWWGAVGYRRFRPCALSRPVRVPFDPFPRRASLFPHLGGRSGKRPISPTRHQHSRQVRPGMLPPCRLFVSKRLSSGENRADVEAGRARRQPGRAPTCREQTLPAQ